MDPALKTGGLKKKDKKVFVDMVKSIGKGHRFHVPLAGSLVDWRRRRRKGGVEGGSTTTLETEHQ